MKVAAHRLESAAFLNITFIQMAAAVRHFERW